MRGEGVENRRSSEVESPHFFNRTITTGPPTFKTLAPSLEITSVKPKPKVAQYNRERKYLIALQLVVQSYVLVYQLFILGCDVVNDLRK